MDKLGEGKALCQKDYAEIILERATRIELAFSAWEADVLPLNYARELLSD